jgi:NitT/TauT family transport system permease protein
VTERVQAFEGEIALERPSVAPELEEAPTGSWRYRLRLGLARLGLLVLLVTVWQAVGGNLVDSFWISRPSEIVAKLVGWIQTGMLWYQVSITLEEMIVGFVLGALAGLAVGFMLGRSEFLASLLDPFILAVYSLPKIALAPLFILWFGIDMKPKIILAAVVVFFLVFYNTYAGVRDVDTDLVNTVRIMGANRLQILRFIVLPGSLTWIFTGLKISIPYALIGAVVGEIMASNRGIGYLIVGSAGQFDTAGVFAALLVLMVIATVLNELPNRSEAVLLRWKHAGR